MISLSCHFAAWRFFWSRTRNPSKLFIFSIFEKDTGDFWWLQAFLLVFCLFRPSALQTTAGIPQRTEACAVRLFDVLPSWKWRIWIPSNFGADQAYTRLEMRGIGRTTFIHAATSPEMAENVQIGAHKRLPGVQVSTRVSRRTCWFWKHLFSHDQSEMLEWCLYAVNFPR